MPKISTKTRYCLECAAIFRAFPAVLRGGPEAAIMGKTGK